MYHDARLLSVARLALLAALVGRVALLAALPGRESVRTARPEGVRVADEGRATLYMAYSPRDGVLPELCIKVWVDCRAEKLSRCGKMKFGGSWRLSITFFSTYYVTQAATLVGHSLHLQNGQ